MAYNLRTKLQRLISVTTTIVLVLGGFLPSGFIGSSPAHAATQAYTFATPGNYSTDSATVIAGDDDVAMFNLTWNTDEGDGLPTSDSMLNMIYNNSSTPGITLATTTGGSLERSTDDGASFTTVTPASWNAVDVAISVGDTNDYIAVGNGAPNNIYHSVNDGASWIAGIDVFVESFTSVTHDSADNHTWAGATDGTVYRSTDGGDNWTSQGSSKLDSISDLLWQSGNVVIASGTKDGGTGVAYSSDSGATWALAALPGVTAASVENTKIAMNGTMFYLGHTGYVATFDFNGQDVSDMGTSDDWTDISANISGDIGTFTNVGGLMSSGLSGIMFISLYDSAASQPRLVSTLDDGTDWIEHAPSDGFTTPAELVRMGDGHILWGITDSSGNAETLISEHYGVADSAVALTGMSVASISSIDVTYHAKSETDEIAMALGLSTGETDTWYFYDTDSWVGSTTDSYLKASGEVEMDANLSTFDNDVPITGDVYLKIYQHEIEGGSSAPAFQYAFSIIDSITVTYTSATVTLTSPIGGEVWNVGNNYNITWEYSIGFDPSTVSLSYSIDSGSEWTEIDGNASGTSPYSWLISEASDNTRVKIIIDSVNDTSDSDFSMVIPSGGDKSDKTDPISNIDILPEYTTSSQFDILVDASDSGGSGLNTVDLYYSFDISSTLYLLNTWDITDPNRTPIQNNKVVFNFDTEDEAMWGDGLYNFYSCATDFSNNSNCNERNLPYEGGVEPSVETFTTVDTMKPHLINVIPENLKTRASVDQAVIINFSENIDKTTLGYQFYKTEYPEESVTDTTEGWFMDDNQVIITHPQLEYDTWYTFKIVNGSDMAGNLLEDNDIPTEWYFKTTKKLDPDLTNSTIQTGEGSNIDGSYNPGDEVNYTITMINVSDLTANTASASLVFNPNLTYKSGSATSSNGTVSLQQQNDQITGLTWDGIVIRDTDVTISFTAVIGNSINNLQLQQLMMVSDKVNFDYYPSPATINIKPAPNFETSIMLVDKARAPAGSSLNYIVTATNTGSTVSEAQIFNLFSDNLMFTRGTLKNTSDIKALDFNEDLNQIEATAIIPTHESISFGFLGRINSKLETDEIITNIATIQDANIGGKNKTISAITTIDNSIILSPELSQLTPLPNATGVALDAEIYLNFNIPINVKTFKYDISYAYFNRQINGWTIEWQEDNTRAKLTPPNLLSVGATYVIEIQNAQDETGNMLANSVFNNKWQFTTVSPAITIANLSNPLIMVQKDQLSNPIKVQLIDSITNEPYLATRDILIRINNDSLTSEIITSDLPTLSRKSITIAEGTSDKIIYYKNSKSSLPNFNTITFFEYPSRGFPDTSIFVASTEEAIGGVLVNSLTLSLPSSEISEPGAFSAPIMVSALNAQGSSLSLPSILYFYSPSSTGIFYDGSLNPLPTGVTVQSTDSALSNIQYFKIQKDTLHSAVFYYRDTSIGTNIITIADNPISLSASGSAITANDSGYHDISTILSINRSGLTLPTPTKSIARLSGIKSVNDGTGRLLDHIKILPTQTQLLPGESKIFYAQGYDYTDRAIPDLEFKWYTPSNGGTLEIDNAEIVEFVASDTIGMFYDAAMVVAMYNGDIKYATIDIEVTDVVEYESPTHLPVSGWNGLQLIFMALTLVAAVLLAWVEHYDKTHFKPDAKKH